jgi:Tfp pilus assembly pilus retraction ATPase PilT
MKPSPKLPHDLPLLPFSMRQQVTDIVVEKRLGANGNYLIDSMRCTLGSSQWYRMADFNEYAGVEADGTSTQEIVVGEVDSMTEWTFMFIAAMKRTLPAPKENEDDLGGSGRRIVFSHPVQVGNVAETLRFRIVNMQTLHGADMCTADSIYRVQMRRIPDEVPAFSELRYNNPLITRVLLSREANGAGIVAITGSFANGKTTSASSLFAERAQLFSSVGFTIEDPPEYNLTGWWNHGQIAQLYLNPAKPLREAIREALRNSVQSFSTQTDGGVPALFFGEVSDPDMAEYALTHANDGKYVLITSHAPNTSTLPQRLIDLAGPNMGSTDAARSALASGLRIVIHQQLSLLDPKIDEAPSMAQIQRGLINAQILYSPNSASLVADAIRANNVTKLEEISNRQGQILEQFREEYVDAPDDDAKDLIFSEVLAKLNESVRPSHLGA